LIAYSYGSMVNYNRLMRIFWPTDLASTTKPGVIVGWRNSDLDVVVVAILLEVDVRERVLL